jgi:hypothetical protein
MLSAGCGTKGEVSGTVTYQGKPLPVGNVTFVDASSNQALGSSTIDNGKYAISKVPAGPVKILVTTPPPQTAAGSRPPSFMQKMIEKKAKSQGMAAPSDESGGPPTPQVTVPTKYGDPNQSGLTYTVQSGAQQHDIDLK